MTLERRASGVAGSAIPGRKAASPFLWRSRTDPNVLFKMRDYCPACLALCLQPGDPRLQLGDLPFFGLDCEASNVTALSDTLGAQVMSVQQLNKLGLDRRVEWDRSEDLEDFGCEGGVGRMVSDRLALIFRL